MDEQVGASEVAKKRLGTGAVIGLVLAVGVVAGIGGTWIRGTDSDNGPSYPSSWDPRVASLVTYVENHRGLTFKHPVDVEFLSDAEFVKEVTDTGSDLTESDKKDLEDAQAQMRALGMIPGTTDLFKASNALQGSGVLGLYDEVDKKIRVRGDQLTPSVRVTLVHELTHVLQDQYYDLSGTFKHLDDDQTADSSAFHAIVEGDATRIEDDYRDSLSTSDQAAIDAQDARDARRFSSGAADVPQILQAMFGAPYPLGEYAVQIAAAKGGNTAVDALFTNPPRSDRSIVDPSLIDAPGPTPTIADISLRAGETEVDRGVFGTLPLFLMLAKTMRPSAAAVLATQDVADRYLDYTKGSTSCVRAAFEGADGTSAKALRDGLGLWASGARTGASVTQSGQVITIDSCDPGASYVPSADHSNDALDVLISRNAIYLGVRQDDAPPAFAMCYADAVIGHYSAADLDRLNSASTLSAAEQTTLHNLAAQCQGS
jgi:hypothetical protein